MVLLKDESVKILNEFDKTNRSAVMNLLMHRYSIPEFDADDILQDAWVLLLEKLTVGEMLDVPKKLGYSCDRVAITIKSRILKKLRNGIQQQERAYGNGLSPVALFYLLQVIQCPTPTNLKQQISNRIQVYFCKIYLTIY